MTDSETLVRSAPKYGPWIVGYAASVALAFFVSGQGLVTSTAVKQLFWLPMLLSLVMIVRTAWARRRLFGPAGSAVHAFWMRMVAAAVFTFAAFAAGGIAQQAAPGQAGLLRALALAPSLGFGAMVWIIHRYIVEESDEFLRTEAIRQALVASFLTMAGVVCWYGLAQARIVEPGEIGKAILLWFAALGLGKLHNEARL